ncbi:MAG: Asp-tRNA(Asn)/Glu-tRNA(Gln) amidotransferase subunit GatC [Anaerolineales bacterium]
MTTKEILNAELVRHIASLVQLGISDEEAEAFAPQLNAILEYFALLQQVDTDEVPPAFLLSGLRNVLRADEVADGMEREAFLRAAPHRIGEYISVPAVLED